MQKKIIAMGNKTYITDEQSRKVLKAGCELSRVYVSNGEPIFHYKDSDSPSFEMETAWYRPTQEQVSKWLRDEHGTHIVVTPHGDISTNGWCSKWYTVTVITMNGSVSEDRYEGVTFSSYENAMSYAIDKEVEKILSNGAKN